MSEAFVAGFAARHDAAARLLRQAFAPPAGFAALDPRERIAPIDLHGAAAPSAASGSVSFSPQGPKHFSPADPDTHPTAGWNPLDPSSDPVGFIDPLAAAHASGFAEGQATAEAAAAIARTRDAALLTDLAAALVSGAGVDRDAIARRLRQTVLALVTKLIGDVGIAPDLLTARIEAAAELLSDQAESALLRLHPDDVALVKDGLPATIFAAGDTGVARGAFILESTSTIVEDGPDLWLAQLAAAIERVPLPAALEVPAADAAAHHQDEFARAA